MHVSFKWLCELVPGLDKFSSTELARRLTMSGLEVEEIADQAASLKGVVVAEVIAKDRHPDADKLSVCRVDAGRGETQVVCGAPNVEAGKKYPFATLGTVMPDGLEIKPVKLRGVESHGMLCSARELKLSEEHAGLLELSAEAPVGDPVSGVLGLDDVVFGLNVTPNRGDALSHWGVAREAAALTGLQTSLAGGDPAPGLRPPSPLGRGENTGAGSVKIELLAPEACPRYSVSRVSGVKVAPSPDWLRKRLEALGQRSINNVVDATNYVMLLTGHPVHAFDAAQIRGGAIRIFALDEPRRFKTLDAAERDLLPGDLVIADAERPVALAGIMGGENSGVTEATRELILEVAFFHPDVIRRTSRRLGLQTESSYRFARFVNPETVPDAHRLLGELVVSLAGGTASGIADFYPKPWPRRELVLESSELRRILGIDVPSAETERILTALGCEVACKESRFVVRPPASRSDLERPVDLIEEVIRVHGMHHVPETLPVMAVRSSGEDASSRHESAIKRFFTDRGFRETVHYSFGEPRFFADVLRVPMDGFLSLKNPLSEDLAAMRPSLLPHLLACYKKNRPNTDKGLRLFELRKVYDAKGGERRVLAGLYAGNPWGRNPYGLRRDADFYDGKGWIAGFLREARLSSDFAATADWPYHPGQSGVFSAQGRELARVGALHPELLQELKIRETVHAFEIEYDAIAPAWRQEPPRYRAVGSLPPVYRDLALLAPKDLQHERVLEAILAERPMQLKHVELFDAYTGGNLPEGKKSLAYSLVYEPEGGESLTDEAVNDLHFALVEKLRGKLGVELR